jgi:large subunit ribosomal protein L22
MSGIKIDDSNRSLSAQAKYVRTSARKARVVLEHIRGRSVPEARTVLAFSTRAAARDIEKVLRSAVANAESTKGLNAAELKVAECFADEGPTLKRWQPRARGRASKIEKRTCHITVLLAPAPVRATPTKKATAAPAAEAAPTAEKPKRASRAKKKEAVA